MTQFFLGSLLAGALVLAPFKGVRADDKTDDRLEERVEKSLNRNKNLSHLGVDVKDGVTTLTGEVANAAEKARAEKLAKSAGAKQVVNNVEIDADKAIAAVKDRAEAKKDRIDENAEKAKDAVDRQTDAAKAKLEKTENNAQAAVHRDHDNTVATNKPNKEVIDPLVTAKVKTKIIKDDLLDKSDINVDTEADGLVTLKGTVPSEAAHVRALELARTTDGVRKVVDRLTIKAPVVK